MFSLSDSANGRHAKPQSKRNAIWPALAAICVVASMLSQPTRADTAYPNRPIRFVVAFAPGGVTDIIARLVGEKLSDKLGQSIIVDNKGGAAGALGAKFVSSADPDGYTLLVTTTAIAIGSAGSPSAVNPSSQLTPIALVASSPTLIAAKAPTAANNLMEFVQAHKSGQVTYSTAGTGTTEHLTTAYVLKKVPGIEGVHVPYRSGAEAVNAVLGGYVDLASTPVASALSLIRDGKLKPLAVASHKRVAMFPEVPTLAESGLVDVENATWVAIFVPSETPPALVQTLGAGLKGALRDPQFRKRLTEMGFDLPEITQPELAAYMRTEVGKWGEILKVTGITLE